MYFEGVDGLQYMRDLEHSKGISTNHDGYPYYAGGK